MVSSVPAAQFGYGEYYPGRPDGGGFRDFAAVGILDAMPDAGLGLFMYNELYWGPMDTPPTFPLNFTVTPVSYNDCLNCFRLMVCRLNDPFACTARGFLAQSGSGTWSSGTLNPTMGSFSGSASNLKYVAWDFTDGVDKAVDGGTCIQIASLQWNVSWMPVDGGMTDGGP